MSNLWYNKDEKLVSAEDWPASPLVRPPTPQESVKFAQNSDSGFPLWLPHRVEPPVESKPPRWPGTETLEKCYALTAEKRSWLALMEGKWSVE